jgi:hypothetical protein
MGLLTLIRGRRGPRYRVRVHGLGRYSEETFGSLQQARMYADYLAEIDDVICLIYVDRQPSPIYSTEGHGPGDEGGSTGVREPRRPVPGSSAGAIALDLPD